MGLLTIIRKLKQKEREVRILVLGLDNAGKTTVVKCLRGEDINTISPTLGFNIDTFDYKGFAINLWDIGGQRSLRPYWRNYFESTDGLIWVVDSADKRRLADCRGELEKVLVEERLLGCSLLVLANKQDLPGAMPHEEIKELLALDSIKSHHCAIYGCSAFTGDNILHAIDWIVTDISQRLFDSD